MKIFYGLVLAFFCTAFQMTAQSTVPDVDIKNLDGQPINLQDYISKTDKIYVLSFWATWCKPCQNELDAIDELYPAWKKEYNVEVIAITIDDARGLSKVRPMLQQKQWDYTVWSDVNSDLKREMNFQTIPQTFLVGPDGRIQYTHNGYVPGDEYELEDHIKEVAEQ